MDNNNEFKILIVDDITENIQVLKSLLITQGYNVKGVTDGQTALKAAKVLMPDLILLDIKMPGMDGYEVCTKLKDDPELKDIPVIFLTALVDSESKVRAFEIGGADYVTKPFQETEIFARVKSQIHVSRFTKMLKSRNIDLINQINKMDEEKLKTMTLLDSAFEQAFIGMGFIDTEGKMLSSNKQLAQMINIEDPNSLIGNNLLDLSSKDDHVKKKEFLEQLNDESVQSFSFELKYFQEDHSFNWFNIFISKILHPITNNVSHIMIAQDISKDKKKDQMLYQQSKMAAIGEMIGNIAHQWRQPLSVISTAASGMLMQKQIGTLTDETFQKNCDSINNSAQFLSKTIDDFRNFFKQNKEKTTFDISKTINNVIELIQAAVKNNNIELTHPSEKEILITSYENEFMQAILNILNNAKDALKDQENIKNKMIKVETSINNNKIQIIITDNGGGINKDIKESIFDPYVTTKHKSQGTGIGLYITYQIIVDHMEGDIKAENIKLTHNGEEYQGAQFTITLPAS